ncbi:alpha/beta fold hydrolase [Sphingomonas nostoxanthinifaciens]|uniref:alpha/beta fold hydrolase n=1 Tax=Sphingomonas nostoxanthinifaciens TaxID=2872652 RepID=UPI001CC21E7A|nr:alpha/beta hydrolase [Sphingomonas nostoxanthinifaciens]UAK26271.1 alpha/beta hydrolase [Sphingomonas nostoxanthinifaciens]
MTASMVAAAALTPAGASAAVKSVVLVHGAFADGSGWKPVAEILERDGYTVWIVQEPETTLAEDVAATKHILNKAGPSVLVGHSYGGVVITEAGDHESARALVYIAAFQPDVGESAGALATKTPAASKAIAPIGGGFLWVDPASFAADFAGDLPKATAAFMAISQVPITASAFGAPVSVAAWKSKPSYAAVAVNDRMINPDLERSMYARSHATTIELPGAHTIYVSQAQSVAKLIEKAAAAAN